MRKDTLGCVVEYDNSAKLSMLFQSHHAEVLAYCVRRLGHAEGEDAASEVFAVASRRVDQIDWKTARPWLYGVARGVLANRRRSVHRLGRMSRKLTSLRSSPADPPDEVVIRYAEAQEAIAALRRLRPLDQEILMLSAWEELSAPEIAASLNISVDAAKKRLERAKRRLTRLLDPTSDAIEAPHISLEEGSGQ